MGLIRVVVPVYKVEATLNRCVESILSQTFSDFEVVLVDDGSPDNCSAICDEYARKDSRIHVIHQFNSGISAARNAGVRYQTEENQHKWLTFVDSDDFIHPQMLELLYCAAEENSADISMCTALECENIPADFLNKQYPTSTCHAVSEQYIISLYQHKSHRYWTAWAKLFHREIVEAMPFEEGRYYEDNNLIFKLLCTARVVADVDASLYAYIINKNGITKSGFSLNQLDFLYALRTQICYYTEKQYLVMRRLICSSYIPNAVIIYQKIRNLLHDDRQAHQLRRHIIWFWLSNQRKMDIPIEKTEYYLAVLLPFCSKVYSYWNAVKKVATQEGISGVLKKILAKLLGRK